MTKITTDMGIKEVSKINGFPEIDGFIKLVIALILAVIPFFLANNLSLSRNQSIQESEFRIL